MMNYLSRNIDADLLAWKNETERKPLLLRGARQVGKSSAVRNLAEKFDYFLEINFENKDFAAAKGVFERHSNSKTICDELSALYETPIIAGKTLLFLDEV
ncbi:MAG: AAA family ATPase, partial [Dysgonamonadaceae bacterium]|nr:AAA family ATPase [Dysgonamonadaceae bacterium]